MYSSTSFIDIAIENNSSTVEIDSLHCLKHTRSVFDDLDSYSEKQRKYSDEYCHLSDSGTENSLDDQDPTFHIVDTVTIQDKDSNCKLWNEDESDNETPGVDTSNNVSNKLLQIGLQNETDESDVKPVHEFTTNDSVSMTLLYLFSLELNRFIYHLNHDTFLSNNHSSFLF